MIDPRIIKSRLKASPSRWVNRRPRRAFGSSLAGVASIPPGGGQGSGRGLAIGQTRGPLASGRDGGYGVLSTRQSAASARSRSTRRRAT